MKHTDIKTIEIEEEYETAFCECCGLCDYYTWKVTIDDKEYTWYGDNHLGGGPTTRQDVLIKILEELGYEVQF